MSQVHDTSCQADGCSNSPSEDCDQTEKNKIQDSDSKSTAPECAVCLQNCIYPACLPCNHVFCYLCVKGVANQSKRCPMCRQEIPPDFLEHPQLLEQEQPQQMEAAHASDPDDSSQDEYQWFYEGRNGWWQYDQRTNIELETAYKQKKQTCELLIAGFLYIADFTTMFQVRRNDHSRRRRIKRDLYTAPKKGIAGLRLNGSSVCDLGNEQQQPQQIPSGNQTSVITVDLEDGAISNVESTVVDSTAAASTADGCSERPGQMNTLHQVLEQMRSIVLSENFPSIDQQNLQNSNDNGSVLDYSLLSRSHQTSSNALNTSDEEET